MHPEDRIQKYKRNGEKILDSGITFDEFMAEESKPRCGGSAVIIYRHKKGGVEILLQKRAKEMRTYPNKWDIHGGFNNYGESPIETAVREAKEELGIDLDPEKLTFCFEILQNDFEFCNYFLYDLTGENQEFQFLDKEVQEIKWVDQESFLSRDENLDLKGSLLNNNNLFSLLPYYLEKYGNLDK